MTSDTLVSTFVCFLFVSHLTVILSPAERSALKEEGHLFPFHQLPELHCGTQGGAQRLMSLVLCDGWGASLLLDDRPNKYALGYFQQQI